MLTKAMTWLSVAALVFSVLSRSNLGDLGVTGLVLFNPVIALPVSHTMILGVELACMIAFLVSMFVLQTQPLLAVPWVPDRIPGSESL